MRTFRSRGERITWTNNTGAAVASGALVLVGLGLVGVACTDIAAGAAGAVTIVDEHEVSATAAELWTQGDVLYLNNTTHALSNAAGDAVAGTATRAKAAGATSGLVKLAGGVVAAGGIGSGLDWQNSVADLIDLTAAEPAAPAVGDRYLNSGAGASSETAQVVVADTIYQWNGAAWIATAPSAGMAVMTEDDLKIFIYTTTWVELGTPANLKDLTDGGNADALHVHDTAGLEDDAVTTAKILDAAVTQAKAVFRKTGSVAVAADELAIPITHAHVAKTTGGDAEALTLADGTPGQDLTISLAVDGGGDGTLTPATCTGFATIVFADAGDTVTLRFVDAVTGWVLLGSAGVAAPPVITV